MEYDSKFELISVDIGRTTSQRSVQWIALGSISGAMAVLAKDERDVMGFVNL